MIVTDVKLTEDEKAHLEALIHSPGFLVLKKVMFEQRNHMYLALAQAESMADIQKLQGKIDGLNRLITVPEMLAAKERKLKEADKAQAKARRPAQ